MPKSRKTPRRRSKASASCGFQHPVEAVTKEELHFALMSATIPMSSGAKTSVDKVFRRAAELLRQEQGQSTD